MSDLYGNNESGDMSSFLQILLQNSSSSPPNHDGTTGFVNCGGIKPESSSSSLNFSDPSSFFTCESERMNHPVKYVLGSTAEGSDSFDAATPNPAPQRSSKRTRAAEVHNLSEKRRRSRINEKLKALQTLIPNSNKTDKASMLDEAIEYLKQLQRQVQVLTVRNGLSLHPGYSLSTLQSMISSTAPEFVEGSSRMDTIGVPEPQTRDHNNIFLQNTPKTTNVGGNSSTLPNFMTSGSSMTNAASSGAIPGFVPSTQNHFGLLNHLSSSKDICHDDTVFRLQLDISCSGNNSSPGVSSS